MSDAQPAVQAPSVVVQRWRRFGRDRAYVLVDGAEVGYLDVSTREIRCPGGEHIELIARATASLVRPGAWDAHDYVPRHGDDRQVEAS